MSISESGPEDVRRRGRDRITAVTTGLVLAGGAGTVAVALAVSNNAAAAAPTTTRPAPGAVSPAVPPAGPARRTAPRAVPDTGVAPLPGLAPGAGQPQVQSGGS